MKRKILTICAYILLIASIGNVVASEKKDPINDFIGEAFEGWGESEFLGLLDLGGGGATKKDIGELSEQINNLSSIMIDNEEMISQLQGEFENLINKVDNLELHSALEKMQSEIDSINIFWAGFENDIGDIQTFEDINKNSNAINKLAKFNSSNSMCDISKASEVISNSSKYGKFDSSVSAYNAVLSDQLNKIDKGTSLPQTFKSFNSSLQIYLFDVVSSLQKAYSIQSTYLYLSHNNKKFKNLTFCIDNVNKTGGDSDYYTNSEILEDYYAKKVNYVRNQVIKNLISDNYNALKVSSEKDFHPRKANDFSWKNDVGNDRRIIDGSWADNCQLYVWKGVSDNPFSEGEFNSQSLTARCSTNIVSINYGKLCFNALSSGLSSYLGLKTDGLQGAALQCGEYNDAGECQVYSDCWFNSKQTPALDPTPWFSNYDTNGNYHIIPKQMSSFPRPPSIKGLKKLPDNVHHSGDGIYISTEKMKTDAAKKGKFYAPIQYFGKNGRKTFFWVFGIMNKKGSHDHWDISLGCDPNDDFCRELDKEMILCMAGEEIKLKTKSRDTAYVEYTGKHCAMSL